MGERQKCPNCTRTFADVSSVYQHIKAKHGGKGKATFRSDCEDSMATRAINAQLDRAMGVPTDDDWLLEFTR